MLRAVCAALPGRGGVGVGGKIARMRLQSSRRERGQDDGRATLFLKRCFKDVMYSISMRDKHAWHQSDENIRGKLSGVSGLAIIYQVALILYAPLLPAAPAQQAYIKASNTEGVDFFGMGIAISHIGRHSGGWRNMGIE